MTVQNRGLTEIILTGNEKIIFLKHLHADRFPVGKSRGRNRITLIKDENQWKI